MEITNDFTDKDQVDWVIPSDEYFGFFFQYASANEIHRAMGFSSLPTGLFIGDSEEESGENLKNW